MAILKSMITPHPPILLQEVGGGETRKVAATIRAMQELAQLARELDPEVVIIISPHGTVFRDALAVTTARHLSGDLGQFGAGEVTFDYENDLELAGEIMARATEAGIKTVALDEMTAGRYRVSTRLDHGMMVPLRFFDQAGVRFRLVPMAFGFLDNQDLYRFGTCIRDAVNSLGRRALVVGSGDLSHRLTEDAPAGYSRRGREYDDRLVEMVRTGDVAGLLAMDQDLQEAAGECGLRSFIIMLGAMAGLDLETRVLSYEGPFGVGYLVAEIRPAGSDPGRDLAAEMEGARQQEGSPAGNRESPPVALARQTLETYVKTGRQISPQSAEESLLQQKAGVFVSLKKQGQLRGCIGTIAPTRESVAGEIVQNAISAGTRDPRFPPVSREELGELVYSVDILSPPEPIAGMADLDPLRYGVIVRSGHRSGLLLPNLEGIDTPEEQVDIARRKAGIGPHEAVKLERFEVIRYT